MACNASPTLTSSWQITSQAVITTSTDSLSVSPPTTVTVTSTLPCQAPSPSGTCIPRVTTIVSTVPGETKTVQVPVTLTSIVTTWTTTTLFANNCNGGTPTPGVTPPTPTPTPPPSSSISFSTVVTPVTFTTQSSSTAPDGSVIIQTVVYTTESSAVIATPVPTSKSGSSHKNIAPAIGGAVGGFLALIALLSLVWFISKRRRRWDDIDIFAEDPPPPPPRPFSLDPSSEPKPYEYGLVGKATAPHPASPPHSPPFGPSLNLSPGGTLPPGAALMANHGRTSSTAPLLSTTATAPSRPSTGGSAHFQSMPQPDYQRPMSMNMSMGDPRLSTGGTSYDNTSGVASPPEAFNRNMLVGGSGIESVSGASTTSGGGGVYDQQRILHVANPHPGVASPPESFHFSDPFSSSAIAAAAAAAAASSSASSSGGGGGGGGSSSRPGSADTAQRDGKGRLRRGSMGKAPIVHLDGGRVQQQLEAATSSGGANSASTGGERQGLDGLAPPAYEA